MHTEDRTLLIGLQSIIFSKSWWEGGLAPISEGPKKPQSIWIPSNWNSGSPLLRTEQFPPCPSSICPSMSPPCPSSIWYYWSWYFFGHMQGLWIIDTIIIYYSILALLFPKPTASISAFEGWKVEALHPSIWGASKLSLFSRVVSHQQKLLWEIIHQFRVSCHPYADAIQLYNCTPGEVRDGNRSPCPSA